MTPLVQLNRLSPEDGSSETIPLSDCGREDKPEVALAILGTGRADHTITLQIHHHGVNRTLVALGIHAHGPDDLGAGLGTFLNQGGADGDAGQSGEVHWFGLNCVYHKGPRGNLQAQCATFQTVTASPQGGKCW